MARRKLYPLPVEGLIDSPDFIAMPAAARGILLSLILHFWLTECRPLPISDHELRSIARAHAPTWRHWRPQVLALFEAIRPELESYRAEREHKRETLRIAAWRANSNAQARAAKTRLQEPTPAPLVTLATPYREAAHGPPTARREAKQAKAFAPRLR